VNEFYRPGRAREKESDAMIHTARMTCLILMLVLIPPALGIAMGEGDPEREGRGEKVYIVKEGDTLWDIAGEIYSDSYSWPFIWNQNLRILNPHWIYPGDVLYMGPPPMQGAEPGWDARDRSPIAGFKITPAGAVYVPKSQIKGFIATEEFDDLGTIVEKSVERDLLVEGDMVFVKFPLEKDGMEGARFTIIRKVGPVNHPVSGERLGHLVEFLGEMMIGARFDEVYRATITYSRRESEVGNRIVKLEPRLVDVKIKPGGGDLTGTVIAGSADDIEHFSQGDIIYIDRGLHDGVEVGNTLRLRMSREPARDPQSGKSLALPENILGRAVVLRPGKTTASALILQSTQSIQVGQQIEFE